jgi:hypothetical protein
MKKITILLIALMVISVGFLSGCNEQTPEELSAPIINFFTVTSPIVIYGNSTVLNWSVTGATGVSIDNGIGNVTFNGPLTIVPTQNLTYTLTTVNSYGSSNASVKIYVIVINENTSEEGSTPIINFFTATPSTVIFGNSSVLNWSVENATSVSIDNGIGNVAFSGSKTIVPIQNQTYTLTAINSYGSSNMSVTVIVKVNSGKTSEEGPAPTINFFTATPNPVIFGNSTVLSWSVTGATSVSIDNGIGTVDFIDSITFSPSSSNKYILTASNKYGTTHASIIVNVKNT